MDVRHLVSPVFPGQVGEMFETVGRAYFLSAVLHIRVLDQQPKKLDEYLVRVTQIKAFTKVAQLSPGTSSSQGSATPSNKKKRKNMNSAPWS